MTNAPDNESHPLVIVGTGGHAVSIGGIIQSCGCAVALAIDQAKAGGTFLGARIAADLADGFDPAAHALVLAIGDNAVRDDAHAGVAPRSQRSAHRSSSWRFASKS